MKKRQTERTGGRHDAPQERQQTDKDTNSSFSKNRGGGGGSEHGQRQPKSRAIENVVEKRLQQRGREEILHRDRTYHLRRSDLETLEEIGKFRTVAVEDLGRFRYGGNAARMEYDLSSLARQGLIERRSIRTRSHGTLHVVVLSEQGKSFLERELASSSGDAQRFFSGFVKPAEVVHDAAIYRMYHAEAEKIREAGGEIRRLILDYELKKEVYSPLAKARQLPPEEYAKRQQEVADANALTVVDGKIPLPDLRVEYETRDGDVTRVDLELATEHYRGSQMAAKALAGFRFYAPGSTTSACSAVREQREITADILSL